MSGLNLGLFIFSVSFSNEIRNFIKKLCHTEKVSNFDDLKALIMCALPEYKVKFKKS